MKGKVQQQKNPDNLLSQKLEKSDLKKSKKYKVTKMEKLKADSIVVSIFYKPISRCIATEMKAQ